MSESPYKDGEVVWVKWGTVWWPGEVWSDARVPEDIITSLRKPVIAFVKFFQEDSFEFVRSRNNISKYSCEKKMDYIKKGMDKYRSNNKVMTNFPADVVKAEQLTDGNINILNSLETPTKSKASSSILNVESVKKSTPASSSPTPATKKPAGSYNSSVKVQNTTNVVHKSSDKRLTCTMCNFATDRMNLLMMHIKNHSLSIIQRVNAPASSIESRRPVISKSSSKRAEADDGIAEDVRKIKESMKETTQSSITLPTPPPVATARKTRTPASTSKPTPKAKSRASKREKKSEKEKEEIKIIEPAPVVQEEKSKINADELKNELLADWLDDDDVKVDKPKISEEVVEKVVMEKNHKTPEKILEKNIGETSRSIRNIPKKQRVTEIYIQPEKVETNEVVVLKTAEEAPAPAVVSIITDVVSTTSSEINKKSQKANNKRKHAVLDTVNEPEKKKISEETDDKLLVATAELLNETEVPKASNLQSPSTFHKSNDIDKRYLPPKERNKRIFRARNSPDSLTPTVPVTSLIEEKVTIEENDTVKGVEERNDITAIVANEEEMKFQISTRVNKNDQKELMLPHKKKQSSRVLTTDDKISPTRETRSPRETIKQEQTNAIMRNKKNRKSCDSQNSIEADISKINVEEITSTTSSQSPLRETIDENVDSLIMTKSPTPIAPQITDNVSNENAIRGQKRQHSEDSQSEDIKISEQVSQPDLKRFHKSDSPQPRTFVVACASEAICITSKGHLSVARRDSIKTTQANSVVVTSQVIISEATKQPISSLSEADTVTTSPKHLKSPTTVSLPPQILKNALKIPKENMEEMKKQGFLTIENNITKLTPKGRQKFKEFRNEKSTVTSTVSVTSTISSSSSDEVVETLSSPEKERTKLESHPVVEAQTILQPKEEIKVQEDKEEEVEDKVVAVEDVETKEDVSEVKNDIEKVSTDENIKVEQKKEEESTISVEESRPEQQQQQPELQVEKEDKLPEDSTTTTTNENGSDVADEISDDVTEDKQIIESTNTETEKDAIISSHEDEKDISSPIKENNIQEEKSVEQPIENGNENEKDSEKEREKELEVDTETPSEDPNSGNAGLIALQAENFGGPANCFYLCRQVEDGYQPVDNQILVLNAQNALVPYEGEMLSEVSFAPTETIAENLAAYSQLSPNSNIIINTPNGQKIELSQLTILALQDQADENGIASIELSGEQLELNINGILEAIAAQQDGTETGDTLIPGTMLIDSADALTIIDSTELPVDLHHSATQVSETLSKPIMSTTVAPEIATIKSSISENVSKNLNIEDSLASIGVTTNSSRANVPKSLELPITVTNPTIAETVNHRKLAAATTTTALVAESFVVQSADNGSDD